MGARGPKPVPDNVRRLRGNPGKRKSEPHPTAVPAIPSPPKRLKGEALAAWKRITPELDRMRLLAHLDRDALVAYCDAWSEREAHKLKLEAEGYTVPANDHDRGLRKHPVAQLYREADVRVLAWAKELGLTPNSRGRMRAPDVESDDEVTRLLD